MIFLADLVEKKHEISHYPLTIHRFSCLEGVEIGKKGPESEKLSILMIFEILKKERFQ